jgi:hypothetical protein
MFSAYFCCIGIEYFMSVVLPLAIVLELSWLTVIE